VPNRVHWTASFWRIVNSDDASYAHPQSARFNLSQFGLKIGKWTIDFYKLLKNKDFIAWLKNNQFERRPLFMRKTATFKVLTHKVIHSFCG